MAGARLKLNFKPFFPLNILTDWFEQILLIQIKLLLQEWPDQGLHYFPTMTIIYTHIGLSNGIFKRAAASEDFFSHTPPLPIPPFSFKLLK